MNPKFKHKNRKRALEENIDKCLCNPRAEKVLSIMTPETEAIQEKIKRAFQSLQSI